MRIQVALYSTCIKAMRRRSKSSSAPVRTSSSAPSTSHFTKSIGGSPSSATMSCSVLATTREARPPGSPTVTYPLPLPGLRPDTKFTDPLRAVTAASITMTLFCCAKRSLRIRALSASASTASTRAPQRVARTTSAVQSPTFAPMSRASFRESAVRRTSRYSPFRAGRSYAMPWSREQMTSPLYASSERIVRIDLGTTVLSPVVFTSELAHFGVVQGRCGHIARSRAVDSSEPA